MIPDSAPPSIEHVSIGRHYPATWQPRTWADLVALEPRLSTLADRARAAGRQHRRCRTLAWWRKWESIKRAASRLVGWHCRREALGSCRCYEIAISELYRIYAGSRRARR